MTDGSPGVSCTSIIAIRPTPDDPQYNAAVVSQFRDFFASQKIDVPVPSQARDSFTGDKSQLQNWPGTMALNRSYSETLEPLYSEFARKYGDFSHSLQVQDEATCVGNR